MRRQSNCQHLLCGTFIGFFGVGLLFFILYQNHKSSYYDVPCRIINSSLCIETSKIDIKIENSTLIGKGWNSSIERDEIFCGENCCRDEIGSVMLCQINKKDWQIEDAYSTSDTKIIRRFIMCLLIFGGIYGMMFIGMVVFKNYDHLRVKLLRNDNLGVGYIPLPDEEVAV